MRQYRLGFIIEQTLGHVTHHRNLAQIVAADPGVKPIWLPIRYSWRDRWAGLPVIGRNASLHLSLRARACLAREVHHLDALLFHTQTTAMCSLDIMGRLPSIVSLDATPVNRMSVEAPLGRPTARPGRLGGAKRAWLASVLKRATAVIAWSDWCGDSVINDYGVPRDRVHRIPPGVDTQAFRPTPESEKSDRLPRLLFVGGDFHRKGGASLVNVFRNSLVGRCELDIVTMEQTLDPLPGLRVHHGVAPNSPALHDLYAKADAFVLPTDQDYTPLAILEGMACGLPVIATDVGAIREQVVNEETGFLIPRRDEGALSRSLNAIVNDASLRRRMGNAARARAQSNFDARTNYGRLIDVMKLCVDRREWKAMPSAFAVIPT